MKKHIVVTATKDMPVDVDTLKQYLTLEYDLEIVPLPFGDMSLAEREAYWTLIARAEALFVRTGVIPYELVGQCRGLKVIALHGVGVDQVDVKAATEAGIYVTNAPGGNAQAVAEFTFALMLSAMRQIPRANQFVKHGQWDTARTVGRELRGKKLGIIGLGNIGELVALLAHAFGMDVVYWDRVDQGSEVAKLVTEDELFKTADIVSVHVGLNDSTRGFIDRSHLSLMKHDAWLINTARGGVIVQADLIQALEEQWFAGAALDVFEQEPLTSYSPFLQLSNVILTPHMAGSSKECLMRLAEVAGKDISAVLKGNKPQYAVNQPWGL
ncbi:MAG: D-3-phosphoglycerate dehydrogenase [Bacillota bacterium]|nr:MAG: D-3-phosphoglycerate dehydrogenase [Bacillota bacterium]MBS3949815.1 hydroxyacid dehydrogenase [Peptococcaceae bacterium]